MASKNPPSDSPESSEETPEPNAPTRAKRQPKKIAKTKEEASAEDLLLAKLRRDAQEKIDAQNRDKEEYLYVMGCRLKRNHHGAYFTEDPVGKEIHDGMWFNLMHKLGEPYGRVDIQCQECKMLDIHHNSRLRVSAHRSPDTGRVTFRVPDKHAKTMVRKIAKNRVLTEEKLVGRSVEARIVPDEMEVL